MCNYFTVYASTVSSVPLSRAPLCALQRAHILLYSDEHDVRPRAAEARAAFMSDAHIHVVRNETLFLRVVVRNTKWMLKFLKVIWMKLIYFNLVLYRNVILDKHITA